MANLDTNEKQVLEKLLQMSGGGVLNFTNRTIQEFFIDDIGIDIYDDKYNYASGSKANRVRGFWQISDKQIIAKSIHKLIEYIKNQILIGNLDSKDFSQDLINRGKEISDKLIGIKIQTQSMKEEEFLNRDFKNVDISKLGLDSVVSRILQQRIDEIKKCLNAKAPLSVIFLCGSTLEGILLGIASNKAKEFNQSIGSPKDKDGKIKLFQNWNLNDFINVARELNLIGEDVKKFSHALRDFRNYIHPYQQMSSNFNPDEHSAKICWQVLQTAIIQLSE
jgi:hypothetical protein